MCPSLSSPQSAPDRSAPRRHALRGEIVDLAWMRENRGEWDALAAAASSPNPFYAPLVLEAHVAHDLIPPPLFAIARRGGRLLAVLPLDARASRLGWLGKARSAVHSPFMVSATPLVSPDGFGDNLEALLDALASRPGFWRLPLLRLDDAVGEGLREAVAARGWACGVSGSFARAVLDRRAHHAAFEAVLAGSRRKDMRRRWRRLAELGSVTLRTDTEGPSLATALESFLALEASGWKGARGTALASRPATASYARALAAQTGTSVGMRLDRLMLDGKAIAGSIALLSGGTAYLYKTAYDEDFARYAPGILLEGEIVRAMHETAFASRLNSASVAGGVLDTIFPDREAVGDFVFSTSAHSGGDALRRVLDQDLRRQGMMQAVKRLLLLIKGPKRSR